MSSPPSQPKHGGLSKVKHIILVLSGKGGVGKSTVCCQLAMFLAMKSYCRSSNDDDGQQQQPQQPLRVGIIDADLCGPSVSRICGAEGFPVMQAPGIGWKPVEVPIIVAAASESIASPSCSSSSSSPSPAAPPPLLPKLYIMSMASLVNNPKEAIVWKGPRKDAMIKQFLEGVDWGELDYLFIDTPPGTSDEHLTLCELLNPLNPSGAIVVTTPQSISTDDVRKELHFLAKLKMRCLGIVENLSGFVCPHCTTQTNIFAKGGGEKLAEKYETAFLGRIPIDPVLSHAEDLGVALWEMLRATNRIKNNNNNNNNSNKNDAEGGDASVVVSNTTPSSAPSAVALENVMNEVLKQLARIGSGK